MLRSNRLDVECATGYAQLSSARCEDYAVVISGIVGPLLALLGIAVLLLLRRERNKGIERRRAMKREKERQRDKEMAAANRRSGFQKLKRLWDERTCSWKAELVATRPGIPHRIGSLKVAQDAALHVDVIDRFGYLPLHYAVSANAPLQMVESLIASFPLGPSTRDAKRNLALHLAVSSGANTAVVRALCTAFPAGVLVANADGELPVQLIASSHTYNDDSVVELAELLAFPVDCEGHAENWFYLLQLEEHHLSEARARAASATGLAVQPHLSRFAPSQGALVARLQKHFAAVIGASAAIVRSSSARIIAPGVSEVPNHLPVALMVSAVLDAARSRSVTVEALAYARDKKGRIAIDVATIENKRCLWRHLLLLGRYAQRRLLHQSNTSCVWEVEDKETNDEGLKVLALKQVGCELHFAREIALRAQHRLSDAFVVQVVREHSVERIFLMPHCDCSLEHALCSENFAGISADLVRSIAKQLAMALMHIHTVGVVHGDLKPKNICRLRGVWKLIDFDAAAAVGGTAGSKITIGQAPANMPPELASRVFRTNFPANVIRAKLAGEQAKRSDIRAATTHGPAIGREADRHGPSKTTGCSGDDDVFHGRHSMPACLGRRVETAVGH
jgi:hypothetical protein